MDKEVTAEQFLETWMNDSVREKGTPSWFYIDLIRFAEAYAAHVLAARAPSPTMDSPTKQEEARQEFEKWYDAGPFGNCDIYVWERMWAAWQAGARSREAAAYERAAELVCADCKNGLPLRIDGTHGRFAGDDMVIKCMAAAIRAEAQRVREGK